MNKIQSYLTEYSQQLRQKVTRVCTKMAVKDDTQSLKMGERETDAESIKNGETVLGSGGFGAKKASFFKVTVHFKIVAEKAKSDISKVIRE